MKRIVFLAIVAVMFSACSKSSDGPKASEQLAQEEGECDPAITEFRAPGNASAITIDDLAKDETTYKLEKADIMYFDDKVSQELQIDKDSLNNPKQVCRVDTRKSMSLNSLDMNLYVPSEFTGNKWGIKGLDIRFFGVNGRLATSKEMPSNNNYPFDLKQLDSRKVIVDVSRLDKKLYVRVLRDTGKSVTDLNLVFVPLNAD